MDGETWLQNERNHMQLRIAGYLNEKNLGSNYEQFPVTFIPLSRSEQIIERRH